MHDAVADNQEKRNYRASRLPKISTTLPTLDFKGRTIPKILQESTHAFRYFEVR